MLSNNGALSSGERPKSGIISEFTSLQISVRYELAMSRNREAIQKRMVYEYPNECLHYVFVDSVHLIRVLKWKYNDGKSND